MGSPVRLKKFKVQGFRKVSPAASTRESMKSMLILAVNYEAAQATYARCHGVPSSYWRDGSSSPYVVIRAEAA